MSNKIKNILAIATVLTVVAVAAPASAQTVEELQAQIQQLLAQIQQLQAQLLQNQTGSSSAGNACTFTRNLFVGVRGDDVMCLQNYLISQGYSIPAGATGFFGPQTKAAVSAWQQANGVSPAAGYFGAISRAKYSSLVQTPPLPPTPPMPPEPPTPPTPPAPGPETLQGGAGSVDEWKLLSSPSDNRKVGEGQDDVKVIGISAKASKESDLAINAVRVVFDRGTATSTRFSKYAKDVSVWVGDKEYARVDASEFTSDNNWTKTITLKPGAIIKKGETANIYVAVSGVSNLDSGLVGKTWTVDITNVRYIDGTGAVLSEDPSTDKRTFSFESVVTASNTELQVALDSSKDDVNLSHVIDIDDNNDTNNVEILAFTIKVKGTADILLKNLPVKIETTEAADNNFDDPDDVITGVHLLMNGEEIASKTLDTSDTADDSDTVTFKDLDLTLRAGRTYKFSVAVDIIPTSGVLDNGDTIKASTEVADIVAEDPNGDELETSKLTGTAVGEPHAVYDAGIKVTFVSASANRSFVADATGESDTGEYKITFDVTAFDGDFRIDKSAEVPDDGSDDAGQGVVANLAISAADTTGWTITGNLSSNTTDSGDDAYTFKVKEGTTRRFTLTVSVTPDEDSFVAVYLASINWGSVKNEDTNDNYYTFNLNNFRTDSIFLNDM